MPYIRSIYIISVLLVSSYSVLLAQEITFQREVDSIPVIENGVRVHSPFAGGFCGFSNPSFVDIDSDGDLDLFVGEAVSFIITPPFPCSIGINFYLNTGTATNPIFTLEREKLIDRNSFAHAFADIDNDGDFDLFVGQEHGSLHFYRNTGTPTDPSFTLETQIFSDIDVGFSSAPTFADIDHDGDLDLFVGEDAGNINFYRNEGSPATSVFALETENFANIDVRFDSTPTFADIDNDGDPDLFVGAEDGSLNFYRNTGTITDPIFTLEAENFSDIDVGFNSAPTLADVNNDGNSDLFVGEGNGNINFYRNTSTTTDPVFIPGTKNFVNIDFGFGDNPIFADIDNDGDSELFVGELDGNIHFYRNTGTVTDPTFTLETESFANIDGGDISAPTFADIDNDGDSDLFVGKRGGNINFYRNTGTATDPIFTLETENFANINVGRDTTPTFADIDSDGDLDIFLGKDSGNLDFYRNTGTPIEPVFTLDTELVADIGGRSPSLRDIDNDGDLDLFLVTGNIIFYRNTGKATEPNFTLEPGAILGIDIGFLTAASAATLTDIDNDGDFDVFVGVYRGGLQFYRNIGFLGDIDNDGIVDVDDLTRVIEIILGTPPESTDEERTAADVNNDGRIDVRDLIIIINIILGIR